MDVSEPTFKFNTIPCKSFEIYLNSIESCSSSSFSDIPNSVENEEDYKDNDATPKDQLKKEIEE